MYILLLFIVISNIDRRLGVNHNHMKTLEDPTIQICRRIKRSSQVDTWQIFSRNHMQRKIGIFSSMVMIFCLVECIGSHKKLDFLREGVKKPTGPVCKRRGGGPGWGKIPCPQPFFLFYMKYAE